MPTFDINAKWSELLPGKDISKPFYQCDSQFTLIVVLFVAGELRTSTTSPRAIFSKSAENASNPPPSFFHLWSVTYSQSWGGSQEKARCAQHTW